MPTITIASQVIGFISFGITLLTLLGVYRDFISTVRHAPKQIPILLGNLRHELEAERVAVSRRMHQGDEFGVFPKRIKSERGWKKHRTAQVTELLNVTITELWNQFKALERPFLIRSWSRAEKVHKGDFWEERDLTEKSGGGSRNKESKGVKNPMGMEEAAAGSDPYTYYRTDFAHRFLWWQSKSDVVALMDQVQRVQVRRIERDVFETDELVKRCYRIMAEQRDAGESASGREETDGGRGGGGGGGTGGKGLGFRRRRSRKSNSVQSARVARSRSRNQPAGGGFRESSEVEVVRVRERDRDREDMNLRRESERDRERDRGGAEVDSRASE